MQGVIGDASSFDAFLEQAVGLKGQDIAIALAIGAGVGLLVFLAHVSVVMETHYDKRRRSRERDKLAATVGQCLTQGRAPPPFALYLRPFQSTGYQFVAASGGNLTPGASATIAYAASPMTGPGGQPLAGDGELIGKDAPRFLAFALILLVSAFVVYFVLWRIFIGHQRRTLARQFAKQANGRLVEHSDIIADFENILDEGVSQSKKLGLIGLGNPGETLGGAGRLRVQDSEWKTYIDLLMKHSQLNVLVLSPRPGTLWEVEKTLSTDAWKKTLFVQPPIGGVAKGAYAPDADYEALRETFSNHGAVLPARNQKGVAFKYGDLTKPPIVRSDIQSAKAAAAAYKLVGGDARADMLFASAPPVERKPLVSGLP